MPRSSVAFDPLGVVPLSVGWRRGGWLISGSLLSVSVLSACSNDSPAPTKETSSVTAPAAEPLKVEWIQLPSGVGPADFVRAESARADHDKKKLVIYVGATWCEPCQRFHHAAEAGELDRVFGDVRFIDLDADKNASEVAALGCESKMIPLFALPGPDGRCTDRRVEGGIKGDGAVGYISPKLRAVLGP